MKVLAGVLLCILTSVAVAQQGEANQPEPDRGANGFDLFESVEQPVNSTSPSRRPASANNGRAPTQPDFILQGTSKIGNRQNVILQHSSGKTLLVKVKQGENNQVPGYKGYSIIGIERGRANIRLPDGNDCVEFQSQGVSCSDDGRIARLSLVNAEPLIRKDTPAVAAPTSAAPEAESSEPAATETTDGAPQNPATDAPTNPFAALRAANEEDQQRRENGEPARFTPRRIDPADVPPGKRVVSTPFGDRLVDL